MSPFVRVLPAALVFLAGLGAVPAPAEPPAGLSAGDAKRIARDLNELDELLRALRRSGNADPYADAEVFRKGVEWALRYETKLEPADVALVKGAVARCAERADAVAAGKPAWADRRDKVVRGYVSAVDGSVQPFGLVVPANYDPKKPARLDVVLHGSTKPVGLSELRFMSRFDEGDGPAKGAPYAAFIELHPLGRVENCYRWPARPTCSRRSEPCAATTRSTATGSSSAACRWARRARGTWASSARTGSSRSARTAATSTPASSPTRRSRAS